MNNIFGIFIHWDYYSQLALHEQVIARYGMDNAEYKKHMHTFNPVNYNPEW